METPVKKAMTKKLFTVQMGTTLFEAYQLMKEKRIRHLPVIDEKDDVVGIISHRDLSAIPNSKNVQVEMMMSSPVEFVSEDVPLRQAVFLMLQKKISSLLISDKQDNAIGIITTDDLLWYLSHLLADETDETLKLLPARTRQTIGAIANEISEMGI
jgi:CBS domain-containing protein